MAVWGHLAGGGFSRKSYLIGPSRTPGRGIYRYLYPMPRTHILDEGRTGVSLGLAVYRLRIVSDLGDVPIACCRAASVLPP